ncbi:MAG: flagellar basal body rod protein FlgB [Pseudomonadota bacterium]
MLNGLNQEIGFFTDALNLRAYRHQILAANIANADTPNYKARDFDFAAVLRNARSNMANLPLAGTSPLHLGANPSDMSTWVKPLYRQVLQPSLDGNTVDTDVELAQFSDNAIRYQADLIFLRNKFQKLQMAIQGQ